MRFQLSILSILATVALFDSVAAVCCVGGSGIDPCGTVALTYKIMSEDIVPEVCCCAAANSLACRAKCVSHISSISCRVF
jgi:hypothetical protein